MANRDGTGPAGQGPLTGRGMGPCARGSRRGFGFGMGYGQGANFGQGRGFRRGYGFRSQGFVATDEKTLLEADLKDLDIELKELDAEKLEIEKRLKELKAKKE